jgi:hypothetical protein
MRSPVEFSLGSVLLLDLNVPCWGVNCHSQKLIPLLGEFDVRRVNMVTLMLRTSIFLGIDWDLFVFNKSKSV